MKLGEAEKKLMSEDGGEASAKERVRTLSFAVSASRETEEMFASLILSYAHFQNTYIMLRKAAYDGANPEKAKARFEADEAYRKKKFEERQEEAERKNSKRKVPRNFEPKAYVTRTAPALDFSDASKARHAVLLAAVSRPAVIRSLFQERDGAAAEARERRPGCRTCR